MRQSFSLILVLALSFPFSEVVEAGPEVSPSERAISLEGTVLSVGPRAIGLVIPTKVAEARIRADSSLVGLPFPYGSPASASEILGFALGGAIGESIRGDDLGPSYRAARRQLARIAERSDIQSYPQELAQKVASCLPARSAPEVLPVGESLQRRQVSDSMKMTAAVLRWGMSGDLSSWLVGLQVKTFSGLQAFANDRPESSIYFAYESAPIRLRDKTWHDTTWMLARLEEAGISSRRERKRVEQRGWHPDHVPLLMMDEWLRDEASHLRAVLDESGREICALIKDWAIGQKPLETSTALEKRGLEAEADGESIPGLPTFAERPTAVVDGWRLKTWHAPGLWASSMDGAAPMLILEAAN